MVGQRKDATTATMEDASVPMAYSTMIGFMDVRVSTLWFAMDAATRKKTSTGATAFKAEMKNVPRNPRGTAMPGATRATMMPITSANRISLTRDPSRNGTRIRENFRILTFFLRTRGDTPFCNNFLQDVFISIPVLFNSVFCGHPPIPYLRDNVQISVPTVSGTTA